MALYSAAVEYGLHCLLFLAARDGPVKLSSLDLAAMQGVSPTYVAKLFAQLKTAGIVHAIEGAQGGYQLARDADAITVLDVVDALEGSKPLFQCRDIRRQCAVFGDAPPDWSVREVCGIHAVMLEAEQHMKRVLAGHTLANLAGGLAAKASPEFFIDVNTWFEERKLARRRRPSPLITKEPRT